MPARSERTRVLEPLALRQRSTALHGARAPQPAQPERTRVLEPLALRQRSTALHGARAPQPAQPERTRVLEPLALRQRSTALHGARAPQPASSRNAPAPTRAARLTHENVIRRSEARRTRALPRWRRRATARGDAFTVQNGSICIKKVELGSFTGLWRTPTEPTSNPTPRTSVTRGRAPVCGPSRKRKRFNGCIGS
jgi:hypothetical protein